MNTGSSGSVFISNVDDYLAPSQACVNPLYNGNSNENDKNNDPTNTNNTNGDGTPQQQQTDVVIPRQRVRKRRPRATVGNNPDGPVIPVPVIPEPKQQKDPIKASMADCLACSGCVTTAETVLLEQQHSLTALKQAISEGNEKILVATISPAVWADMLRHLQVIPSSLSSSSENNVHAVSLWQRKLVTSLHQILQVRHVLDGNIPLQWSLLESGEEFCRAYRRKQQMNGNHENDQQKTWIQQLGRENTPSMALNAQQTLYMLPDGSTPILSNADILSAAPSSLPLLTSSCPALVCLAEKQTHGAVHHLAHTKSPMSMAGSWWRQLHRQHQHGQAGGGKTLFHLAFMPCHDKKLEASRKDFARLENTTANNITSSSIIPGDSPAEQKTTQDVDLVLTTQEWFQMLVEFCQTNDPAVAAAAATTTGPDGQIWSKEEALEKVKQYLDSLPPAPTMEGQPTHLALTQSDMTVPVTFLTTSNGNKDKDTMEMEQAAEAMDTDMDMDMDVGESVTMNGHTTTNTSVNKQDPNADPFYPYGSGGLAEFVFRYAAWRLFDQHIPEVVWKPVVTTNGNRTSSNIVSARVSRRATARNRDYFEATLFRYTAPSGSVEYSCEDRRVAAGGVPVLKFAIAYGLQTLQRVLEPFQDKSSGSNAGGDISFDFVEAMACPSGCLNGGGQLRVADRETPTQTKQRVALTRELFVPSSLSNDTQVQPQILETPLSQDERQTRFHVVPPLTISMGAAAGVAVKDTQW